MASTVHVGLCVICLALWIKFLTADLSYPSIMAPDPQDKAVLSFKFDDFAKRATIDLEEEVDYEICIALLNYKETDPPIIGPLSDGKNNLVLGAVLKHNDTTKVWSLWINKKQDYEIEMMRIYRFFLFVGSSTFTIILNIMNIDDNPPVVQALQKNCAIEENRIGPSTCKYLISDADGWIDDVKIELGPESEARNFEFVYSAGQNPIYELEALINVTTSLDFETISIYMLEIQAIDGAKKVGALDTVVKVVDVADMPPIWTQITTVENILEKTTKLIEVAATDGDIQIKAEINYMIEFTDSRDKEYFVVNDTTGAITINEIDRDERNQDIFRFVIIAYEKIDPDSKINATITVIVEDDNDHSPEITPDVLEIELNEETYTTLEFQSPIEIKDPDLGENAQFSVRLIDSSEYEWSSAFLVVPTSGYQSGTFTVSVANASLLDYEDENWRVIDIQLQAIEKKNASHIGTKNIRINLRNLNDELPIFDTDTPSNVSVHEDERELFSIATVHATDRDVNDNVTHSLVAQHTLTIDEKTGEIVTNQADAFDYESMSVVVVQIVAADKENHKTYTALTINVIDVNDEPPKLFLSKERPTLREEMPPGTLVNLLIEATDIDTDAELTFHIDWANTRAQKSSVDVDESHFRERLSIETEWPNGEEDKREATGKLLVTGRIDYEAFDVMFLTISVTDHKTKHNDNTTSATLALYIEDVNDNDPKFLNYEEIMEVTENQIKGALIGTVTAIDDDGPANSKISYSIEPIQNTEDDLVVIDNITGIIKVGLDKGIDADKYEYMYYNVTASDGERNSTITINIYVIDQNDEVPYLLDENFESTIYIPEEALNGTYITTIEATDDDRTSPFNNVSYLMNTNYSAPTQYFSIGKFNGVIRVNLADERTLDRDRGQSTFTLNLKLRDNYLVDFVTGNSNSIDRTVTIILLDINDEKPMLPDLGDPAVIVTENTKKGERILSIAAKDLDDPETNNTKVFYVIKSIVPVNEDHANLNEKYKTLFDVKTRAAKTADIFTNYDLKGFYGDWIIELYVQDLGTNPGPQNDTRNYVVQVKDFNYNKPLIEFPTEKQIPLRKDQTLHTQLRTYDDQPLSNFKASDEDYGDSGVVTFTLTSSNGEHEYFEIISIGTSTAQLRLAKSIDVQEKSSYKLTVVATDGGSPPLTENQEFTVIFVTISGPKFETNELTVWMKENTTGIGSSKVLPEAHDMLSEIGGNAIDIYYYFMPNEPDSAFFTLDKTTRNLTIQFELDREKQDKMHFHVVATADKDEPPRNPLSDAVLEITVIVLDENDEAPVFETKSYSAGVTSGDALDKIILSVKAADADLNDTLTYSCAESSMTASHSSLYSVANPFSMNPDNGDLGLNFTVTSNMEGFFEFDVLVHDKVKHHDTSIVRIYVVPESSRVIFTFNNLASYVKQEKQFMIESFTEAYGYLCNVDNIQSTINTRDQVLDNSTTVTTHFISQTDNLPISADTIVLLSSDLQTVSNLKAALLTRLLYLADVPTGSTTATEDTEQIVHWILVTLTILFFLCNLTLLTVCVIRTRRLNRKLDKLAITQYAREESIFDRVGIVPTTNQFALAGSNPIWKTPHKFTDDNFSQGSGDSNLIGIEDNPDFGYVNHSFMNGKKWEDITEGSVNPAFANHAIMYGGSLRKENLLAGEKNNISYT